MEAPHHGGPRMPNETSVAMSDGRGVCWRQTRALVERPIDDKRQSPGQRGHRLPGCGSLPGWLLGEACQGRDCDRALGLQPLRTWGLVPSGKPRSFREGMLPGHDHQKHEGTRADVCTTSTDQARTGDPSLPRLRAHVASPVSRGR